MTTQRTWAGTALGRLLTAAILLALLGAVIGMAAALPPPHKAGAAATCLDGDPGGWCRVADPVVRFKGTALSQTSSALAAGGRTTRYIGFASIDYQHRAIILAFEDVGAFQPYSYQFGLLDPSACTFIAHDDGTQIGLKGFCAQYNGDGQVRTLVIWDSGWRYFGP